MGRDDQYRCLIRNEESFEVLEKYSAYITNCYDVLTKESEIKIRNKLPVPSLLPI